MAELERLNTLLVGELVGSQLQRNSCTRSMGPGLELAPACRIGRSGMGRCALAASLDVPSSVIGTDAKR